MKSGFALEQPALIEFFFHSLCFLLQCHAPYPAQTGHHEWRKHEALTHLGCSWCHGTGAPGLQQLHPFPGQKLGQITQPFSTAARKENMGHQTGLLSLIRGGPLLYVSISVMGGEKIRSGKPIKHICAHNWAGTLLSQSLQLGHFGQLFPPVWPLTVAFSSHSLL